MFAKPARQAAARGYVMVVQDVRGRNASDGEYHWMFGPDGQQINAEDGFDTVEWAATLPHSDGRVGVWGNSYSSAVAWRLAGLQPPSLAAMFTSGMPTRHRHMTFGVLETGRRLQWAYGAASDLRRRSGNASGPYTIAEANHAWTAHDKFKWIWKVPLASIPREVFGELTNQVHELYRNAHREFWNFDAEHPRVMVPTSSLTGWWDRLIGNIFHYTGMEENGPLELRGRHKLTIGPWCHDTDAYFRRIGPRDYGPEAEVPYVDLLTDYFDYELKGVENSYADSRPVRVFILNENRWRRFDQWPPAGIEHRELFLASGGSANTAQGDGYLADAPSGPADRYTYDPADPVMSLITTDSLYLPADPTPLDTRQDILCFQTDPLEKDVVVVGSVICHLWAATDAPDTDFHVKLTEIDSDGSPVHLAYGLVRARYRNGFDSEAVIEPGEPYEYRIEMLPIGIRFTAGSRIRIDISSSDFPAFDRNHNTGRDFWSDPELRPARQIVFHDANHPSRIILPILPD